MPINNNNNFFLNLSKLEWFHLDYIAPYTNNLSTLSEQAYALLLNNDQYVIKVCKAQRFPKDYYRKYFGCSQAMREFNGAKILNNLGIKTPIPIATSFNIIPWSKIESIYVMSYLKDCILLGDLQDEIILKKALFFVAKDLQKMFDKQILFKDLHLNNIVYSNNEVTWIDTDIKYITNNREFSLKSSQALHRMIKPLSKNLQSYFMELL